MAPPTVPRFFPPCKAYCDYACGLKEGDNIETVCTELRNMFSYFKALRTTKSHLCYFDFCGNVLDAWGKTGGQQEDPLEMITFCLSIHHLWDAPSPSITEMPAQ